MEDKQRCSECGSWEAECAWDEPQEGCHCARCLGAKVKKLEGTIKRLKLEASLGKQFYRPDKDCKGCGGPTAQGYTCFFCGEDNSVEDDT